MLEVLDGVSGRRGECALFAGRDRGALYAGSRGKRTFCVRAAGDDARYARATGVDGCRKRSMLCVLEAVDSVP